MKSNLPVGRSILDRRGNISRAERVEHADVTLVRSVS